MLEMKNIYKIYRTEHVETHALSDFSLDVASGAFLAVMGPSGSGKTTFLNTAGLLDTFEKGTYGFDGQDVTRLSDREMSRIRNTKIGFIFQTFNLMPRMSVCTTTPTLPLLYRRQLREGRARRQKRAGESARDRVGLSVIVSEHRPAQLSGGQQQRVAIARALAGDAAADSRRRAHRQPGHGHGQRHHGSAGEDQRDRHHGDHGDPRSRACQPGPSPDSPAGRPAQIDHADRRRRLPLAREAAVASPPAVSPRPEGEDRASATFFKTAWRSLKRNPFLSLPWSWWASRSGNRRFHHLRDRVSTVCQMPSDS